MSAGHNVIEITNKFLESNPTIPSLTVPKPDDLGFGQGTYSLEKILKEMLALEPVELPNWSEEEERLLMATLPAAAPHTWLTASVEKWFEFYSKHYPDPSDLDGDERQHQSKLTERFKQYCQQAGLNPEGQLPLQLYHYLMFEKDGKAQPLTFDRLKEATDKQRLEVLSTLNVEMAKSEAMLIDLYEQEIKPKLITALTVALEEGLITLPDNTSLDQYLTYYPGDLRRYINLGRTADEIMENWGFGRGPGTVETLHSFIRLVPFKRIIRLVGNHDETVDSTEKENLEKVFQMMGRAVNPDFYATDPPLAFESWSDLAIEKPNELVKQVDPLSQVFGRVVLDQLQATLLPLLDDDNNSGFNVSVTHRKSEKVHPYTGFTHQLSIICPNDRPETLNQTLNALFNGFNQVDEEYFALLAAEGARPTQQQLDHLEANTNIKAQARRHEKMLRARYYHLFLRQEIGNLTHSSAEDEFTSSVLSKEVVKLNEELRVADLDPNVLQEQSQKRLGRLKSYYGKSLGNEELSRILGGHLILGMIEMERLGFRFDHAKLPKPNNLTYMPGFLLSWGVKDCRWLIHVSPNQNRKGAAEHSTGVMLAGRKT